MQTLEEVKAEHIRYVLLMCCGNSTKASAILDITIRTLRNFLDAHEDIKLEVMAHRQLNKKFKHVVENNDEVETGYKEPTHEERDWWYNRNFY